MNNIKQTTALSICLTLVFIVLNSTTLNAQWSKVYVDTLNGPYPFAPYAGDIENDGDMDILVMRFINADPLDGEIVWYEAPNWTRHIIDDDAGYLEVIDFNDDNQIDIVAANVEAGEIVWYEAPSWSRHVIDTLAGALGIDVVDLDNDGNLDILGRKEYKTVWYEGPDWVAHTLSTNLSGEYVQAADMDSDGDLDVFLGGFDGLGWLEAPSWTFHSIVTGDTDFNGIGLDDMDNDGDLDVVIAHPPTSRIIMYENPSWTEHTIVEWDYHWGLCLADLDSDSDIDIVATDEDSSAVMWFESPSWTRHDIDNALQGAGAVGVADINNNGSLDIVALGTFGGNVVYYESPFVGINGNVSNIPQSTQLLQNYPNPFNASTSIKYSLLNPSHINIAIFDLLGRKVETLIDETQPAGYHQVVWGADDFSSGVYFYKLQTEYNTEIRGMVLLK